MITIIIGILLLITISAVELKSNFTQKEIPTDHMKRIAYLEQLPLSQVTEDLIEDILIDFDVPQDNIDELFVTRSTLLPESPQFNILQRYLISIGLITSYIKVGQRYQLSIQLPSNIGG